MGAGILRLIPFDSDDDFKRRVSTGEVSGVLESNEQLEYSIPAVSIDENLRAQSLLIASYWPN